MALSRIKEEYLQKRVAFGKGAAPLYKRDDIDDLAIIALESKDKSLINLFEFLPPLAELKKKRVEEKIRGLVVTGDDT